MARPTRAELTERYRERLAEVRAETEARHLREAGARATDAADIPPCSDDGTDEEVRCRPSP